MHLQQSKSRDTPKPLVIKNLEPSSSKMKPLVSKMTPLGKKNQSEDSGLGDEATLSPLQKNPGAWAKAAEFVPGQVWQGSGRLSSKNWIRNATYHAS